MENIKDYLKIIIITYNRAYFLKNTLDTLYRSPFNECYITVLNNASTDNTLEVCISYEDKFENLNIVTHKFNIGGNANLLRAVELSNGKYTWILADDDEYDFSDCDDFIDTIIKGKVDLIHVGAHTDVPWNRGGSLNTPRNLLKIGYPFFRFASFIPCNVFKTSSFYPYIIQGYDNIVNLYPHMPFLMSFYELNKNIYITKHRVVKAIIGNQSYSSKDFINGWLNTALFYKKREDRYLFLINQFIHMNTSGIKKTSFPVLLLYLMIRNKVKYFFDKFCSIFGVPVFFISLIILPLFMVYTIIKKLTRKLFVE